MVDSKLVQVLPWLLHEGLARCRADSLCARKWWPGLVLKNSGELTVEGAAMAEARCCRGDWNPDGGRKRRWLPWRLMVAAVVEVDGGG
ncbi:hypothetical protein DEO72_LG2g3353 [Vigna unguiculata]|uniref:Uncharacterized protein n=1 Tax=Vigna unguiculata TaxID=3917 RepID=A0A4D6L3D0_VIGUN|nr:hypothetical protein DEO72_LG2g3353 [Vigna unguiculata]